MTAKLPAGLEYLTGTGWVDRPTTTEPSLAGEVSCDVAIVGGGLGGMAAALRLAELGIDVVLLEADLCGWGASGRNAGYVTPTVGSDPRILQRFYADRVRGLIGFANHAIGFTEGLIEEHSIKCHYERTGSMVTAVTARQLRKLRKMTKPGGRTQVQDSREAGVPPAFLGGLHVKVGGVLNPGEFSLAVRDAVLAARVRVFEGSPVRTISDPGARVTIETPNGCVRADKVLLTTNAFTNELAIAPRWLSTPMRITAVETEPVPEDVLDATGWTSRTPMVTAHLMMESYRTTSRGTVVFSTRKVQMPRDRRRDQPPDQSVVADLVRGFRERFPTLSEVQPARTWSGWIGLTPANLAVAGQASPRVFYSMACNGHGLPQAPYLGHLLADHIVGGQMHDDLRALWREKPRFAPGIVSPASIHLAWVADRLTDRLDALR